MDECEDIPPTPQRRAAFGGAGRAAPMLDCSPQTHPLLPSSCPLTPCCARRPSANPCQQRV
eukprot:6204298-Pleurochrysis_carterae.AAC.6